MLTSPTQWGVIGPKRLFSHGELYYGLVFFFLAGAILPVIQWVLHKKFHFGFLKYLNFPLIFIGTGNMPPATPLNYVPWVLVCFVFNYVVRRRHFGWWSKYNCEPSPLSLVNRQFPDALDIIDVLSAGLDAGYAVGLIIIFFTLQYPKNGTIALNSIQSWWGNTVYVNTGDFVGVPNKVLADGETFGPTSW